MRFQHSSRKSNTDAGIDDAKIVDGRELHIAYEFAINMAINIVINLTLISVGKM
jgi:hypothetical protein